MTTVNTFKADVSSFSPSLWLTLVCFETLNEGQLTLSTQFIIVNYHVTFSNRRSNTVSLKITPFISWRRLFSSLATKFACRTQIVHKARDGKSLRVTLTLFEFAVSQIKVKAVRKYKSMKSEKWWEKRKASTRR